MAWRTVVDLLLQRWCDFCSACVCCIHDTMCCFALVYLCCELTEPKAEALGDLTLWLSKSSAAFPVNYVAHDCATAGSDLPVRTS